ncbi:hypothetical protein [Blastococcus sp. TBT05-19]|uniref:hypothetical protein n=1 Tax=Blastococcus sp. TBT05-19 TaxID=2250581 RepID=UPI0011BF1F21|nr:hypothetical protein [Blastococcus sp. TBT05-19]
MSPAVNDEQSLTRAKEPAMFSIEHEIARSRFSELQAEAEAATRARRLYLARRANRRAERAVRRAARASAAVY